MNGLMIGQDRHEGILRSHLEKFGCTVELGTKLQSFEQYPDHVEVELIKTSQDGKENIAEKAQFAWVVGADGGHSVVRQQLGLNFLGETRDNMQIVVGDIHVKKGVSRDVSLSHLFQRLSPDNVAVLAYVGRSYHKIVCLALNLTIKLTILAFLYVHSKLGMTTDSAS